MRVRGQKKFIQPRMHGTLFRYRCVLIAFLTFALLGCGAQESATARKMIGMQIPSGWGLAYGRIHPGRNRLYIVNRNNNESNSITTDGEGHFFTLLPSGEYSVAQLRGRNQRAEYKYPELAAQFTVPSGRSVYLGDLKVLRRAEMQLSDNSEAATQRLRNRYPDLPLEPAPEKSLMYSPTAKVEMLVSEGKFSEALEIAKRTHASSEKRYGSGHYVVGLTLRSLAVIAHRQGRNREAEGLLRKVRIIFEKTYGPEHNEVAQITYDLGMVYLWQERYDEALPLLQKALRIYKKNLRPDHPHVKRVQRALERYGVVKLK